MYNKYNIIKTGRGHPIPILDIFITSVTSTKVSIVMDEMQTFLTLDIQLTTWLRQEKTCWQFLWQECCFGGLFWWLHLLRKVVASFLRKLSQNHNTSGNTPIKLTLIICYLLRPNEAQNDWTTFNVQYGTKPSGYQDVPANNSNMDGRRPNYFHKLDQS